MPETITIREVFEEKIGELEEDLAELKARLGVLEEHAPEVLSALTEAGWDRSTIWSNGYFINIHDYDKHDPGLGVALLDLSIHRKVTVGRRDGGLSFSLRFLDNTDDLGAFNVTLYRHKKEPCKKARVTETKEIEVCGSLDEGKYDKVVWLESA